MHLDAWYDDFRVWPPAGLLEIVTNINEMN